MYYAKDYRAMARNSLKGHWPISILVCFIAMILGGLDHPSIFEVTFEEGYRNITIFGISIGQSGMPGSGFDFGPAAALASLSAAATIYAVVIFIIGGAIELGVRNYFIKLNYDMNPKTEDMFSHMKIFGKALGLRIVMTIFIVLWTCLFIIPGIVAFYRYSMATYIMAENPDIGIMEAIDASKAMMKDRKWALFCLNISFIGWIILCGLTAGLGYIFLHPYMESARAHFYLTHKHGMVKE